MFFNWLSRAVRSASCFSSSIVLISEIFNFSRWAVSRAFERFSASTSATLRESSLCFSSDLCSSSSSLTLWKERSWSRAVFLNWLSRAVRSASRSSSSVFFWLRSSWNSWSCFFWAVNSASREDSVNCICSALYINPEFFCSNSLTFCFRLSISGDGEGLSPSFSFSFSCINHGLLFCCWGIAFLVIFWFVVSKRVLKQSLNTE